MVAAGCNRCKSIWYQLCQYCHEYAKSNEGDCKINLICASYEPYTKRSSPAKVGRPQGKLVRFDTRNRGGVANRIAGSQSSYASCRQ